MRNGRIAYMFDLEDNDQFSKLSAKDKKSLLKFLKNYYIEYKSYLGLDERMTFGIEIECFIPKQTRKTNEHSGHTSFSLHKECTVNNKFGWEFQSPILQDNPSSWSEIKDTCEYLKSFCKINERCGGHIHFGASIFQDNCNYLMNLVYLWMAYEDIIYRFGNGEYLNTRVVSREYAPPVINTFKLYFADFGLPNNLEELLAFIKKQEQESGINFYNYFLYYKKKRDYKNTIEVRCPNGTLEEVIWQNNINFFGKLVQAALNDEIDLEKLYYYIMSNSYSDNRILDEYGKIKLDKSLELADLIYDNNYDKLAFLKQYVKNGKSTSSKTLVKTTRFWK